MTIQKAFAKALQIVLVELGYPYGKTKVYMNSSLFNVAARLIAMGHAVRIIDFNLDRYEDAEIQLAFRQADLIGIGVVGSPYIPDCLKLANQLQALVPNTAVLVGGQVTEGLREDQFYAMFSGTNAIQVRDDEDLANLFDIPLDLLPSPYDTPMSLAWKTLLPSRLKRYLSTEFSLVLSQNCIWRCKFCAAPKGKKEQHVDPVVFEADLRYLAAKASEFGLQTLSIYLSPLDTFQNPKTIAQYLGIMARVRRETGCDIRSRCLSCTKSLVRAERQIPNLGQLVREAGIHCIGFGIDGSADIWVSQNKGHNNDDQILECFELCHKMGVSFEALLVTGFPEQGLASLIQMLRNSVRYVSTWSGISIRPYVAKEFIPGNEVWAEDGERVAMTVADPRLFYNLDFAACASKLTDPDTLHRWITNIFYLGMLVGYSLIGRCPNNPLFPQGGRGIGAAIAKQLNRLMPYDR